MTRQILRTELRRGLPFAAFPVGLLVMALGFNGVFSTVVRGLVLRWSSAIAFLTHVWMPVLGVLALAVAVWQGDRERRTQMRELLGSTPRASFHRTLAQWLPTAVWPVIAYTVGASASALLTAMAGGQGQAMVGVLMVPAAELTAAASVGFVVGRYVPWKFTAPVVAALGMVAWWAAMIRGDPTHLLVSVPADVRPWERPVWWFAGVSIVWFLALAATVLVSTISRRRWMISVPIALAVAVAVPIARAQTWHVDTASPLLACSGGSLPICVTSPYSPTISAVAATTRGVRTRLEQVPVMADAYVLEEGSCLPSDHNGQSAPPTARCPRPRFDPSTAGRHLAHQVARYECRRVPPKTVRRLERGVEGWLLGRPTHAPQLTARIAAMTPSARRTWLRRYLNAAHTCDISAMGALMPR